MDKCNKENEGKQSNFTAVLPLTAIGAKIRQVKLFKPIEEEVKIHQKIIKYRPVDKLMDGYIALLSGAQGLKDVNKQVRGEPAVQKAFGRTGCAEQSVVQDTLDASCEQNVSEMKRAIRRIFQANSQAFRHDYAHSCQLLDVDLTGRPCGKKAALASKGYFSHTRNRRGRQEGYLIATWYKEIVAADIYAGNTLLNRSFQALVEEAEKCLDLNQFKREHTILRVDSGGGSLDDINWALQCGYHFHGKQYGSLRLRQLAKSVTEWYDDPEDPGRQMGWVEIDPEEFVKPVWRIAVRCRKDNGQWGIGILVSSLTPQDVLWLSGVVDINTTDDLEILLAYVHFYDQRGGGIEIEIKEDKQGLSITKRTKKRAPAQQILTQLEVLAHNTLVWARSWLAVRCPTIAQFGLKRFIREVLHLNGLVTFDQNRYLRELLLNAADPLAASLAPGLAALLAQQQVAVSLGEI
jgi:hypothetical protein